MNPREHGPAFYEQEFSRLILGSPPVTCHDTDGYELHMLTCERDQIMALWALKTFYHYSGQRPPLVVHEDGSFAEATVGVFRDHFPGCRIIRYADTLRDDEFRARFEGHPLCELWRFKSRPPLSLRVFDFPHYARSPYILQFDSDVLFFRHPREVIELCGEQRPFISTDYRSSYAFTPSVAHRALGIELLPRINTGLGGFPTTMTEFALTERILRVMIEHHMPPGIFRASHAWIEQTVTACLFCAAGYDSMLPVERYQLSSMLIGDDTVYQHFVGDGSRPFFYDWGLRHLDEIGFLESQRQLA